MGFVSPNWRELCWIRKVATLTLFMDFEARRISLFTPGSSLLHSLALALLIPLFYEGGIPLPSNDPAALARTSHHFGSKVRASPLTVVLNGRTSHTRLNDLGRA